MRLKADEMKDIFKSELFLWVIVIGLTLVAVQFIEPGPTQSPYNEF
jgi:hypothetical protein